MPQDSTASAAIGSLRRRGALALPLAAIAVGATMQHASAAHPHRVQAGTLNEPLGIALEGYPYPAPLSFLAFTMAGQPVRMAYMDIAPTAAANGRTIFLLHGKNFDGNYWAGPISWLTGAGFRVIVPDQIGFNKSSKPDLDYTFEGLARNTLSLADSLSLQRFTILAHSTGGALAVRLCSIAPQRVEQLVLEDPVGLVDYREYIAPQETSTLVAAEHAYTAESYRAFVAHFFPMLPPAEYEQFVIWRMRTTLSAEFDRFARASALTYQMIYREPVLSFYPGLKMPILLTAGTHDQSAPLVGYATPEARARMPSIHEAAQSMVGKLQQAQFVSFPGVGHVPHLEMPDRFRTALLGFLKA